MEGPKHTPAPWFLITAYSNGSTITHDALAIGPKEESAVTGPIICLVSDLGNVNETDVANARLIAAAPELLEALTAIIKGINPKFDKAKPGELGEELGEYIATKGIPSDKQIKNAIIAIKKATE